jgi:hypothetical protein
MAVPAVNAVLEAVKALDAKDRYKVAMALFAAAPAEKAKKTKNPDAPAKPMGANNFVGFLAQQVRPHIRAILATEGISAEDAKLLNASVNHTQIAKMVWDVVPADSRNAITREQVETAFASWKLNPPAPKPKPEAKPAAEKPKRVMTDEMKAKLKAGREAAKAKKAGAPAPAPAVAVPAPAPAVPAPAPVEAEEDDEEEDEEVPVELVNWDHDFGTGVQTYKRLNFEGMTYVYSQDKEYLGAYIEKTNKLKKSVPNPLD